MDSSTGIRMGYLAGREYSLYNSGLVDEFWVTDVGARLLDEKLSLDQRNELLFRQISKVTHPSPLFKNSRGKKIEHPVSRLITFMSAGGFTKLDLAKALLCATDLDASGHRVYIGEERISDSDLAEAMRDASELIKVFRGCDLIAYDGRSTSAATKAFLNLDGVNGELFQFLLGEAPSISRRYVASLRDPWPSGHNSNWFDSWCRWFRSPDEDLHTAKSALKRYASYTPVKATKMAASILGIPWTAPLDSPKGASLADELRQNTYRAQLIEELQKKTPEENIALAEELLMIATEKTPEANRVLKRYGVSLLMDEQGPVLEEFAQIPLGVADNHLLPNGVRTGMSVNSEHLLTHAGKGKTDLALDHSDMLLVVEATTRESTLQDSETGVIVRHMDVERMAHPNMQVYGLLVAPTIANAQRKTSYQSALEHVVKRNGTPGWIALSNDARVALSKSLQSRGSVENEMREWFSAVCDLSIALERDDWYATVESSVTHIGLPENRDLSITDIIKSMAVTKGAPTSDAIVES